MSVCELLLIMSILFLSLAKPVVSNLHTNNTVIGVEFRDTQLQFMVTRDLPTVQTDDIRWFFQRTGSNVRQEITREANPSHYHFSMDRLTLAISNLTQADDGNYTVEASNIVGTGSDTVILDVQSKLLIILQSFNCVIYLLFPAEAPFIIAPLVPLMQLTGTDASFTCEALAIPLHTTQWQKDGMELSNSTKYSITGLGSAVSVLTIINLELSDAGSYVCFVENPHGNDSTSDELIVQGMVHQLCSNYNIIRLFGIWLNV